MFFVGAVPGRRVEVEMPKSNKRNSGNFQALNVPISTKRLQYIKTKPWFYNFGGLPQLHLSNDSFQTCPTEPAHIFVIADRWPKHAENTVFLAKTSSMAVAVALQLEIEMLMNEICQHFKNQNETSKTHW